ncbi:SELP, partial [Cervus elaphus hippelaphus]
MDWKMNKHYQQEALIIGSHGDPKCRGLDGLADTTSDGISDSRKWLYSKTTVSLSLAMPTLAVTCAPLPNPQNGEKTCVQPLGGSSYKSTCWFTCHEGFSLSGPERLDCTPSGHWTGSPPMCEGRTMGLSFLMASQ